MSDGAPASLDAATVRPAGGTASPMEWAFRVAFGDMSPGEAMALREARDWRLLRGEDPGRFAGLLSVADLDAYLRTDGARTPRVGMADDGRSGSAAVPEAEFALPDGRVDLPRLLQRFDAGASLVVSQFQDSHPPLGLLCRGLEKFLLHGVQANIYLTPAAAQGFRTHFDTHDVLVLQVCGRKRWRVWDGEPMPRPTRRTPWANAAAPAGEPHILPLSPGDALYIPRGVMHDAAAEPGEASLHITLGFLEPAWAEVLRRLIDAEELADPGLREAVPTWRLAEPDALAGLLEGLAARLRSLGGAAQAERVSVQLLDQIAHDRQPLPARGLFLPELDPAVPMRLADGMHHHVAVLPGGSAVLRWACGEVPLGSEEQAWLEALTEGASAAALGGGALGFMRLLHGNGLLEAV